MVMASAKSMSTRSKACGLRCATSYVRFAAFTKSISAVMLPCVSSPSISNGLIPPLSRF
jgi:hypothetical protein